MKENFEMRFNGIALGKEFKDKCYRNMERVRQEKELLRGIKKERNKWKLTMNLTDEKADIEIYIKRLNELYGSVCDKGSWGLAFDILLELREQERELNHINDLLKNQYGN